MPGFGRRTATAVAALALLFTTASTQRSEVAQLLRAQNDEQVGDQPEVIIPPIIVVSAECNKQFSRTRVQTRFMLTPTLAEASRR